MVDMPPTKRSDELTNCPAVRQRTPSDTATADTAAGRGTGSKVAFKRVYAAASSSLSDAADRSTSSSSSSTSSSSSSSRRSRRSGRSAGDQGVAADLPAPATPESGRSQQREVIDEQPDLPPQRPASNGQTDAAAEQEEKVIALDAAQPAEAVIDDDRSLAAGEEPVGAEAVHTSPRGQAWVIPISSEGVPAAVASNQPDDKRAAQVAKVRHYDRREIRTYMAKQKRERKEKQVSDAPATYVCNHSRPADKHRMEALPEAARVKKVQRTKSRDRATEQPPELDWTRAPPALKEPEENWGPSPNFARTFLVPPEPIPPPRTVPIREKSIQTELPEERAPSVVSKVDEAIQVSPLPSNANESTASTWLHVHPRRPATAPEVSIENLLSGSASVSIDSSTISSQVQAPRRSSDQRNAPASGDQLIRQIEHLENYIGHLLDAPPFRTLVPPLPPLALPVESSPSFHRISSVSEQAEDLPDLPQSKPVAKQKHDWTVSTQYRELPDRFGQILNMKSAHSGGAHVEPDVRRADYKFQQFTGQPEASKGSKPKMETGVASIFNMSRNPADVQAPWMDKAAGIGAEEPQTYFRDFNEILQMDCKTNPLTESSLSWKRIDLSRSTRNRSAVNPPPYNILTAISDRLAQGIQQIPVQNTTSDSDIRSGISLSDISAADPPEAAPTQPKSDPKNALGTRIASSAADAGDSSLHLSGLNSSTNSSGSSRKRNSSPGQHHPVIAIQSPTPAKFKPSAESSHPPDLQPPQLRADSSRLELSGLDDTAYRTLTPQYTSFDSTRELATVTEEAHADGKSGELDETSFRPIFPMNLKLSPIPRLDSSATHRVVSSDSEPSLSVSSSAGSTKRKQSTTSERSERDRSVGENPVVVVSRNDSKAKSTAEAANGNKPAELLARLRSELNRDESLRNSLHHLSNIERSAASGGAQQAPLSGKVHVQLDAQTRSFLERQTASIRAMVEDLGSGFQRQLATQSAFVKGSQAAMTADRIKSRSSRTETLLAGADDANTSATTSQAPTVKTDSELQSFQTYSSDFEDGTLDRSEVHSTVASSIPTEADAPQGKRNKGKLFQFSFEPKRPSKPTKEERSRRRKATPPKAPAAAAAETSQATDLEASLISESKSELDPLDLSNDADSSILPPKAVDLLVLEEAKQQRLLLKLREKATVEKTLAELELLQMQKRILRAQGEREKAASIKKKQRGLLLKLQDERAKIEAMRKQHKRQVDRKMEQMTSQAANQSSAYESSSWETDWSAPSADSNRLSADPIHADKDQHSSNTLIPTVESDKESSTGAQPVSEAIQDRSMDDKDTSLCDDDKLGRQASNASVASASGDVGGAERITENPSSVPSFRLRSPLSPRADNIRMRLKFRPRHSSGSDDSINLSQTETTSDVSDIESRVLALTDQLQRRQAEAHRLKVEHKRISKEKLKSHESALLKQIEVYDRCITELRSQLDRDAEADGASAGPSVAMVAVRPLIRQPRAAVRADEMKSPTSSSHKSESEARTESEPIRKSISGADSPPIPLDSAALSSPPSSSPRRKLEEPFDALKSPTSSVCTDIRPDSDARSDATLTPTHERSEIEFQRPELIDIRIQTELENQSTSEKSVPVESADPAVPFTPEAKKTGDVTVTIPPKLDLHSSEGDAGTEVEDEISAVESIRSISQLDLAVSQESEPTASELSLDKFIDADIAIPDVASCSDNLNQTMIVKNDSQLEEELAEEISKAILEQLLNETIELATGMLVTKKEAPPPADKCATATSNVLERVSAILSSSGSSVHQPKEHPSQLYMTTTFDIFSSPEDRSPANETSSSLADEYLPAAAHRQFRSDQSPETSPLPCDVTSPEGRIALELKLNELRIGNDEWIDDELEASPITAEAAIQEARELERKQKRIEQEIQRLSESVLYMQREIPNKPPPPYTFPGQAHNWKKVGSSPPAAPQIRGVPRTREFITRSCRRFAEFLVDRNANEVNSIAFPEELLKSEAWNADQPEAQNNYQAYLLLLSDLTRSTVCDLLSLATFLPGFQRCNVKGGRLIHSRAEFLERVEHAILVELNMKPRFLKENQLTKWSQKKRDRVDEILIKELQMEEKLWTDFSQEELQVKHQTANAIWDLLMNETVALCKRFAIL